MSEKTDQLTATQRDEALKTIPVEQIVEEFTPDGVAELDLYQRREKIYTRQIKGFYQRLRLYTGWPLLVGYFLLPWINWDGRQGVLFDLPTRQFHIFILTFWPQDFPMLAWLLIISAFSLFAVTAWVGRVWCGYTCPQTVWTAIFMWSEQLCEGSRNQRIKRDRAGFSGDKFRRKATKHLLWLGFALLTGITFVGYFSPIRELVPNFLTLTYDGSSIHWGLGGWEIAWVGFFTLATYLNAGWMREQVCMYMCPYARFQSVMFDKDTLIVSYDAQRGERRGARKKTVDTKALGLGDCVDCQICVQVCPTGIDIRDGLQYECINCALCIDACNSVMDQMGYEKGLISYTTENALNGLATRFLRPRLIGYGVAVLLMVFLFTFVLLSRVPLKLDVIRDRDRLYYQTAEGFIENSYTLKVINMDQRPHEYNLSVSGLSDVSFIGDSLVSVRPGEVYELAIRLRVDPADLDSSNSDIEFSVESVTHQHLYATSESRFIGPRL